MRSVPPTPDFSLPNSPSGALKRRQAFTLIEMLIVISIISVLLAMLYGALERAQQFSRRTITFTELRSIESAFKQYYAHYHAWPSNAVVDAASRLPKGGGQDTGFVIDANVARALQGFFNSGNESLRALNPEAIPFIEFSRYSPNSRHPVNPFKSVKASADDTSRSYKVLFDTDGDRQILVEPDPDATGTTAATNVIAGVAVWTVIPATRRSNESSGQAENVGDVIVGSWQSFSVSDK